MEPLSACTSCFSHRYQMHSRDTTRDVNVVPVVVDLYFEKLWSFGIRDRKYTVLKRILHCKQVVPIRSSCWYNCTVGS